MTDAARPRLRGAVEPTSDRVCSPPIHPPCREGGDSASMPQRATRKGDQRQHLL
jgi:hypothetical protein